jgi:hypothetical protein
MLDGRHYSYHVAIDPDGELLWRFPVNAQPGLTIGPDGGYYYVDWQDISLWDDDYTLASWCNITVLNHDGSMRWDYIADGGSLGILGISDEGAVVAQNTPQYFNQTTNHTEWAYRILSLSPQGELLWDVDMSELNANVNGARYVDNGTIELFTYDGQWRYRIGLGEEGEVLYKVIESPYFWFDASTGRVGNISYDVRRMTSAPRIEVVKVCATDITDGSLQWETVIWEDKDSDEPYPSNGWMGQGTWVDSDHIIYATDMNGKIFALDTNGTVLWHREGMGLNYGCFPSGGLLTGDGSSFQRLDGQGKLVWSIDDLEQRDGFFWTIFITGDDAMVLATEGALTKVTVHSEPQFDRSAATFLVLTLVVVAVVVTILYLDVRKDRPKD